MGAIRHSPNPGAPVRVTAISGILGFYFAKPNPMLQPTVATSMGLGRKLMTDRGASRAINTEHIPRAMLFALDSAMTCGASEKGA